MCCLFGLIDYGNTLSHRRKTRLVQALAAASEARGVDAAGIAYNSGGSLRIDKHPGPAHSCPFSIPRDARAIMGHTRMTTQGSAQKSKNNHPFPGTVHGAPFALAHNGVLYNDHLLRRERHLPETDIETDSYIAVQLLEQADCLSFDSLQAMAETVLGSFCFTVLDRKNHLYFVNGNNPLCLYHYPRQALYLYASTEAILQQALKQRKVYEEPEIIPLTCGDLLCIDPRGACSWRRFSTDQFFFPTPYYWPVDTIYSTFKQRTAMNLEAEYRRELQNIAVWQGYDSSLIDTLLADGFTTDEIEDFLYCGAW